MKETIIFIAILLPFILSFSEKDTLNSTKNNRNQIISLNNILKMTKTGFNKIVTLKNLLLNNTNINTSKILSMKKILNTKELGMHEIEPIKNIFNDTNISINDIASFGLDFFPIIGNMKSFLEAVSGEDIITEEKLSELERIISLITLLPFGNYFKNVKYFKNGDKFLKAAQRAKKAGKYKNYAKFMKASARAMKKAFSIPKIINGAAEVTKLFHKAMRIRHEE